MAEMQSKIKSRKALGPSGAIIRWTRTRNPKVTPPSVRVAEVDLVEGERKQGISTKKVQIESEKSKLFFFFSF